MSDNIPTPVENDPLAVPAGEVNTSIPVLRGNKTYKMEIRNPSIHSKEQDDGTTTQSIRIALHTTKEEEATSGELISEGFPVFTYLGITETEDNTMDKIRRNLSGVLKAVFGPTTNKTARDLINNPMILDGQLANVKIDVSPAKGGFPESNRVSRWIPAA